MNGSGLAFKGMNIFLMAYQLVRFCCNKYLHSEKQIFEFWIKLSYLIAWYIMNDAFNAGYCILMD